MKRLRADDSAVEVARNPVLFSVRNQHVDASLLVFENGEGTGRPGNWDHAIRKLRATVLRVDTGVPPKEFLDWSLIGRE